jgi:hypothetical protein
MSNLISKENFNWQKYIDRYKDLKNIDNIDTAWNHWCEEGKKQGRKFFTLVPFKNNKYYIITKEYINKKNKLKNKKSSIVISNLDDDVIIEDYVSNIKHKLKKFNKNKIFVCQSINQNNNIKLSNIKENDESNIKKNNKSNIKKNNKSNIKNNESNIKNNESNIKNNDIEILEKDFKYTEYMTVNKKVKDEWTEKTENSEIFFLDFENNKEDSDESKKYFSKKNSSNIFSNSS